jgi:hypothetical protein
MVLGRGPDQRNPTDVNLLHSFGDRNIDLGDGVLERIQVADNVVNFIDVLFGKVFFIGGKVASENTGMDLFNNQGGLMLDGLDNLQPDGGS